MPIQVDGRVWGISVAASQSPEPFPTATETRIAEFTELVATAISNARSRAELAASRARAIAAADESCRRIQRDLHDGAQQRLHVTCGAASARKPAKHRKAWPAFCTLRGRSTQAICSR